MLLRLAIRGFKNLRNVEIRFGPLTCFVGTNGVGKSNIFDAIQFLRRLADEEIQIAAAAVRSPAAGTFGPLDLFWNADPKGTIEFEADMIVPGESVDDFGVEVHPTISILRYQVSFRYAAEPRPRLELVKEDLRHIGIGDARAAIGYEHSLEFRKSLVTGRRFGKAFISTSTADENGTGGSAVTLHADGGSRGRGIPPGHSPRTVLGGTGSADYPTVVAARREMSSWRALHLEPSALRAPDPFGSPESVDEHGRHIAATLARLAATSKDPARVYAEVANRLADLYPEVAAITSRADPVHKQHLLELRERGSTSWLGARAISDGTLRFLALVAMLMDSRSSAVVCMEEPENGIHPDRIPEIVKVLRDYAVDPKLAVDTENPARQVVLNSHSPDVLKQLDVPEVLFVGTVSSGEGRWAAVFPIDAIGNWRSGMPTVPLARLEDLLGGAPLSAELKSRQLDLFGSAR